MCFFISLVPATFWAVVGYFVLFAATRAEGAVGTFGKVLAVWLLIIALMIPIVGAYVTLSGLCTFDRLIQGMGVAGNM